MGGMGSGRQWYGARDTTSDCRSIDVRRWKRDGLLTPHQSFGWQWSRDGEVVASIRVRAEPGRVVLTYRHRSWDADEWNDESYPIYLEWTPCNLGGERPWFLCPARGCGKRVAILYGGAIFACRHCYDLAYESQREPGYDRAARQADKIRIKLGWEPGILNPDGEKPKGMHCKTFEKLIRRHDALVNHSLASLGLQLTALGCDIADEK